MKRPPISNVAMIGTHFPRHCGIATFTAHLCDALHIASPQLDISVIAVNDGERHYDYPQCVCMELDEQDITSYITIAHEMNAKRFDVVCLQHEYGIFGGPFGSHILELLNVLHAPVVTVLHTILSEPLPLQRQILTALAERSERVVTASSIGSDLLHEIYGIPSRKIQIIPHGAQGILITTKEPGDNFRTSEHFILLSYGLLSINKGFETVIKALPAIARAIPNVRYIILGSTHPNIVRNDGETYRSSLQELAIQNDVGRYVEFVDHFVSQERLRAYIQSADICITPYRFLEQISSGTLAQFVALGKPVVSTPFWYAKEILAGNRGILVPFDNPEAMAREICKLAANPLEVRRMAIRAGLYGHGMEWSQVARTYLDVFGDARSNNLRSDSVFENAQPLLMPPISAVYSRVEQMTDDVGMFQHAKYAIPNYTEGYTTDDNARALIASVLINYLHVQGCDNAKVLIMRYLGFMCYAFNHDQGRFHNVLAFDRRWMDEVGSEESHGRAIWALGTTLHYSVDRNCQAIAEELLFLSLPATSRFSSLRACAFTVFGINEFLCSRPKNDTLMSSLRFLSGQLIQAYHKNSTAEWEWFEPSLTYFNAKLCLALLKSGSLLESEEMITVGLATLEWLMRIQRPDESHFVPIGNNGYFESGGHRARFDQQPIDAYATLSACLFAFRLTGVERWHHHACLVFSWFLGLNDLHKSLYDPTTGGCFDGLQADRLNLNLGAESTLALLLGIIELHLTGITSEEITEHGKVATRQLEWE